MNKMMAGAMFLQLDAKLKMPYMINEKLVVAVASSVLFLFTESDRLFQEKGDEAYHRF